MSGIKYFLDSNFVLGLLKSQAEILVEMQQLKLTVGQWIHRPSPQSTMRINREQIDIIVTTIKVIAGQGACVWLYGSRVDDARRGGDIDLLIEFETASGPLVQARIKTRLEQTLNLPVDVLATRAGAPDSPFVTIARAHAISLC